MRKAARFEHAPEQLPTLQSLAERLAKHARKEKQSLIEGALPEYEEVGARNVAIVGYDELQDEFSELHKSNLLTHARVKYGFLKQFMECKIEKVI